MASALKRLAVLLCITLLTCCAVQQADPLWPSDIPPRNYFERQWRMDSSNQLLQSEEEYLTWIKRFYQGYNLAPGWEVMLAQVESRIAVRERKATRETLFELGGIIGSEWAKSNKVRKVNTRSVAIWRDALRESITQNDLENFLLRLRQDVDALLSGKIANNQIVFDRYYVDEFDY